MFSPPDDTTASSWDDEGDLADEGAYGEEEPGEWDDESQPPGGYYEEEPPRRIRRRPAGPAVDEGYSPRRAARWRG